MIGNHKEEERRKEEKVLQTFLEIKLFIQYLHI